MNQSKAQEQAGEPMEPAPACEVARLPEDLLSAAISLTAPRDACRAAAVSPAFRAAADSDAVWSRFLPPGLPPLADGELRPAPPPSKKALFTRLSRGPVLLADGLVSMWLDRDSGAKCYMLSARALCIVWGSTPRYWRWIPLTGSRFKEAAELVDVCWLEIRGKMDTQMLSQNTKYAAYMVFKIDAENYGLDSPSQEAVVSVAENRSTREVCLQGYDDEDDEEEVPENYRTLMQPIRPRRFRRRTRRVPPPGAHVQLPQKRADGWMELEMGEFFNEGDDDGGEVSISLTEIRSGHWKKGLIVHGVEIREKK